MFITKDAHRPTLTVAINLGDISIASANRKMYALNALAGVRVVPDYGFKRVSASAVKYVSHIKEEIKKLASDSNSILTPNWESRLPKLDIVSSNYVVLYNLERNRVRTHEKFGTTVYLYVIERSILKNAKQNTATFIATVDPKATVPDLREGTGNKVFQFEKNGKVYYVKSKTEADRHGAQNGLVAKAVNVFVTEDGRFFPIESEIKDFETVDLFTGQVHFDKNAVQAENKFGKKNVFKVKIEGARNRVFFNVDVEKLEKGYYKAKGADKTEQVLVVEALDSFSGVIRSYHLIERTDARLKKVKDIQIITTL
jgi:hypothetical protein